MNVGGGEAADQMVRMLLSGTEVTVRLTGSALKNLLALSLALARNHKQISGKVNLGKMLRETRDLRQFPMTPEQYRQFEKLARKQKLLFSAVRDRDDRGKLVDVILPVTELDRANQIFERLLTQTASREQTVSGPQKAPRERQGQDERPQRASVRRTRQKKVLGRNETRPIQDPAPLHPARARIRGRPVTGPRWRNGLRGIGSRCASSPLRPERGPGPNPSRKRNDHTEAAPGQLPWGRFCSSEVISH